VRVSFFLSLSGVPPATTEYDLYAVVEHMGSLNGGHYVAHVRLPESATWFTISDSTVSRTDAAAALRAQAYLLFYRRRSDSTSPAPAVP
jgi:ubiquitin carboxyl-terminal hydrolase 4/11